MASTSHVCATSLCIAVQPWGSYVGAYQPPPDGDFSSILVPTLDTVRSSWLLQACLAAGRPCLFVGGSGTAKTVTVQRCAASSCHSTCRGPRADLRVYDLAFLGFLGFNPRKIFALQAAARERCSQLLSDLLRLQACCVPGLHSSMSITGTAVLCTGHQ
jgi:P-loop containing dynein motor region